MAPERAPTFSAAPACELLASYARQPALTAATPAKKSGRRGDVGHGLPTR